jgi:hypothetical protein
MAKFVPLTLMSKTQKMTLYLNMDQVRYLRPQTSGGTTIYFGANGPGGFLPIPLSIEMRVPNTALC